MLSGDTRGHHHLQADSKRPSPSSCRRRAASSPVNATSVPGATRVGNALGRGTAGPCRPCRDRHVAMPMLGCCRHGCDHAAPAAPAAKHVPAQRLHSGVQPIILSPPLACTAVPSFSSMHIHSCCGLLRPCWCTCLRHSNETRAPCRDPQPLCSAVRVATHVFCTHTAALAPAAKQQRHSWPL